MPGWRVLQELFYDPPWTATEFPSYAPELASNPFITYTEDPGSLALPVYAG